MCNSAAKATNRELTKLPETLVLVMRWRRPDGLELKVPIVHQATTELYYGVTETVIPAVGPYESLFFSLQYNYGQNQGWDTQVLASHFAAETGVPTDRLSALLHMTYERREKWARTGDRSLVLPKRQG